MLYNVTVRYSFLLSFNAFLSAVYDSASIASSVDCIVICDSLDRSRLLSVALEAARLLDRRFDLIPDVPGFIISLSLWIICRFSFDNGVN